MKKEDLMKILSAMPEDTPVNVVFSYGRTYSCSHVSVITGTKISADTSGNYTALLCALEVEELDYGQPGVSTEGSLSMAALVNLLKIVPDGAEIAGCFTYKSASTLTVESYISSLNLHLTADGRLNASIILYKKPDADEAKLNKAA